MQDLRYIASFKIDGHFSIVSELSWRDQKVKIHTVVQVEVENVKSLHQPDRHTKRHGNSSDELKCISQSFKQHSGSIPRNACVTCET